MAAKTHVVCAVMDLEKPRMRSSTQCWVSAWLSSAPSRGSSQLSMAMIGSPRMSRRRKPFLRFLADLALGDHAGLVAGGENAGDVDDLRLAASGDRRVKTVQRRERQPAPGDGGEDERKRHGPVIVAGEREGFDEAQDALQRRLRHGGRRKIGDAREGDAAGSYRMPVAGS